MCVHQPYQLVQYKRNQLGNSITFQLGWLRPKKQLKTNTDKVAKKRNPHSLLMEMQICAITMNI